jgi:small nuclear ribonucleoprotein (snRNP)-like protein
LISDSKYAFNRNDLESKLIYQTQFCGDECSISFIINPQIVEIYNGKLISIGNISIMVEQGLHKTKLYLNVKKEVQIEVNNNDNYLCVLRFSKCMNLVDFMAYLYTYNENIPIYKLQNNHYLFDMDNPVSKYVGKYDIELSIPEKSDVILHNYYGTITNFKLFDIYDDQLRDMLQMYPNNQHLLINDTARKLVGLPGSAIR